MSTRNEDLPTPLLQELLQRLDQQDAHLRTVAQHLEQLAQHQAMPTGSAPAEAPTAEAAEEEAEEEEEEPQDRLTLIVSLLTVLAAFVVIGVTFLQEQLDPRASALDGLAAAFNRQMVESINYGELYANVRAYTPYVMQNELARQLEQALPDAPADQRPQLEQELRQAQRVAASSRLFFPLRYLNRDGTYDRERQLGESWARALQQGDLDPEPYFTDADAQRRALMQFVWFFLWLTVALCTYELLVYFNRNRRLIRISLVSAATVVMVVVFVFALVLMDLV